ncbi:bifunctional 2-keto-4-hydroxyglutarate aldolase/2-keto-3-deoxy-6-phosphogluconate aldolase [Alkalihalophilus sp. As8PL]|uniref:Bifunctional 2-keto-4-hydroxyglutarate aldolase/2-keto-3-deoxy-6-phosphogluconate aldolase n=1 Tax=Alkalihalophilus sp. As8PL TaxID=3237103 RepID=A0AB39BNR5_9BACI|nr:bifunctional 2-keto-4-hydroxyglutarate aldolase/2-keto-3-deoxy-6-phosphogluconate aldolase [Bacillus sp. LL01]KMJ56115.1 ketohydroxyglutarate aldolase [Bacillus sp. LL01]
MKSYNTLNKMITAGITAVVRGDTFEEAETIANGCIAGGITSIEVTFTTPDAVRLIKQLSLSYPDITVGAGSVLDSETARIAILNGAEYVVSPCFDKGAAMLCNRYQVPYVPGCMTIREMKEATEYGVSLIKLFPGNQFEPSFIKSVKGPLPHVEVMPTGGVNASNVQQWIENGAAAVGVGSDWNKALKTSGEEGVIEAARNYVNILSN